MADNDKSACPEGDSSEKDFRKKNLWTSFKAQLYTAVGGACFIGLLTKIAGGLIDMAASAGGTAGAGALFGAGPMGIMIGLLAVGVVCTFKAQQEWTELRCLQDEHMAHQNAVQLNGNGHAKSQAQEFNNPGRRDGKSWEQVALAQKAQQQGAQQATR